MRKLNKSGSNLIKHFESFSPVIYKCSAGVDTIGWGFTDKRLIKLYRNKRMSRKSGDKLFDRYIRQYCAYVEELITVPLTNNEFAALVSFTFNLGYGNLRASTLRRVINRKDYDAAPKQFGRWIRSAGKVSNGLIRRRKTEAMLWECDDFITLNFK